jgi:hypothetical protein
MWHVLWTARMRADVGGARKLANAKPLARLPKKSLGGILAKPN